ncbi:MAG: regulatory iron-sulfur-containing complex subunit RicT, partial [Planctomycetota bacterium]|nr:regulatory iron-sulfur-containing complex subunit RicT [Planctomycetota bacterium]
RELVQRLAKQYHTRIEMRQIGARDEARLLADYERCGRQCCCREYLKLLKPISMRMAKVQKATLDPAKISGRCGRLMCCLRYEDKTYEELRRKLPKKNTWVRTDDGVVGKVLETQIITQLVRLEQVDNRQIVVPNEEIVERDMACPPETPVPAEPVETDQPEPQPVKSEPEPPLDKEPYDEDQAEEQPAPARAETPSRKPRGTSRRRRKPRRKEKKPRHPGALSAAPQVQSGAQAGRRNKKKRRRRKPKGNNLKSDD